MSIVLSLVIGYLIGGIPTGILVCRLVKGIDPRGIGSGSSGATNVSRVAGKGWAIFVLLIDIVKGFAPVKFLAPVFASPAPESVVACSLAMTVGLVAGHIWTPYANFRGGKGVATTTGAMLALDAFSVLIALAVWFVLFLVFRYVSLASIIAAIVLPVTMFLLHDQPLPYQVAAAVLALLILFTHRGNIRRLLKGEEKRFL
ncbi:MAG TPA: glycerol-3-phosphate 1-O-acyltransferase PlsY [bacterium]